MYEVRFRTSGIVAVRFTNRAAAQAWVQRNDLDSHGDPMHLFMIVKVK
jgi:hypothetical protein